MLKGERKVWLREDARPAKGRRSSRPSPAATGGSLGIEEIEQPLWSELRRVRWNWPSSMACLRMSSSMMQPCWRCCAHLPANEDELGSISGVGENKLKRYGKDFLAVLTASGA